MLCLTLTRYPVKPKLDWSPINRPSRESIGISGSINIECIRLGDINGGVEILIPYYMPLHLGVEAVPLDQQEETLHCRLKGV